MFSGQMRPEVLHTFVDTFVEGKKAQVKQRLRQAMETVLDDLFGELLGQLKDMLLPAIGADRDRAGTDTGGGHQTTEAPKQTRPKSPPSRRPVYAVKSKPGTSAGGGKRPREPDPASPAIVVEIQYAGDDLASSEQHQEAITVSKKARTEPDESTAPLDLDPQSNPDNDDSDPAPPLIIDDAQAKFVCSYTGCGKRFKNSGHLKDHERLHSGATPFSCKFPGCSQTGKRRFSLIRHIRTVHLKHLEPGQEVDPKAYLEVNEELLK